MNSHIVRKEIYKHIKEEVIKQQTKKLPEPKQNVYSKHNLYKYRSVYENR